LCYEKEYIKWNFLSTLRFCDEGTGCTVAWKTKDTPENYAWIAEFPVSAKKFCKWSNFIKYSIIKFWKTSQLFSNISKVMRKQKKKPRKLRNFQLLCFSYKVIILSSYFSIMFYLL
jgi:hypothetical protein